MLSITVKYLHELHSMKIQGKLERFILIESLNMLPINFCFVLIDIGHLNKSMFNYVYLAYKKY